MVDPKKKLNLAFYPGFLDPIATESFVIAFWTAWTTCPPPSAGGLSLHLQYDLELYGCTILGHSFSQYVLGDQRSTTGDRIELSPLPIHPIQRLWNLGAGELGQAVPTLFLGFSAGVLRAAIDAAQLHAEGLSILGVIALDGWGVPLQARHYPNYRMSHDCFTHQTSDLWGGRGIFFADPPVPHLSLWVEPEQTRGWFFPVGSEDMTAMEMTAMDALICTIQVLYRDFAGQNGVYKVSNSE